MNSCFWISGNCTNISHVWLMQDLKEGVEREGWRKTGRDALLGWLYSDCRAEKHCNCRRTPPQGPQQSPPQRLKLAISCTAYRIQNPSEPQNTPQNTPPIPSQNQKTTNLRKIYENSRFLYFFSFFRLRFGSGRRLGVYFGVYFGDQRGFVFCTGRRRSQNEADILQCI